MVLQRQLKLIEKPLHDKMFVIAIDEPGPGGANHVYEVVHGQISEPGKPSYADPEKTLRINFQKGPVNEVGVNGVSDEALLAILIDRAKGFAKGEFASAEGTLALRKMQEALSWLETRFRDRAERGVEGYNKQ